MTDYLETRRKPPEIAAAVSGLFVLIEFFFFKIFINEKVWRFPKVSG
jgi:hypothetical protein